jgi:GH24 family phage-related lysozyme (muramidase)
VIPPQTVSGIPSDDVADVVTGFHMQKPPPLSVTSFPDGQGTFTVIAVFPPDAPDAPDHPPPLPDQPPPQPPQGPPGRAPGGNVGPPVMNEAGFRLLQKWEGCILCAYDDANDRCVNPGDTVHGTLTIGYGHTGSNVFPGLTWTAEQAEEGLHHDVDSVEQQIKPLIKCALNDNQFSAFVCFAFNIGTRGFGGSSALHLANEGDLARVPTAIALWNKARVNGVAVPSRGLTNRRNAEIDLWNS